MNWFKVIKLASPIDNRSPYDMGMDYLDVGHSFRNKSIKNYLWYIDLKGQLHFQQAGDITEGHISWGEFRKPNALSSGRVECNEKGCKASLVVNGDLEFTQKERTTQLSEKLLDKQFDNLTIYKFEV
jgi:hypothetical protein